MVILVLATLPTGYPSVKMDVCEYVGLHAVTKPRPEDLLFMQ